VPVQRFNAVLLHNSFVPARRPAEIRATVYFTVNHFSVFFHHLWHCARGFKNNNNNNKQICVAPKVITSEVRPKITLSYHKFAAPVRQVECRRSIYINLLMFMTVVVVKWGPYF